LDAIHNVGSGGDFLTAEHTLAHFRELWQPTLLDRSRADDWAASGSLRLNDRLREKTLAIMEEHDPEPLPDAIRREVADVLGDGA
jgi:trimethylamine--corrinoid protein Co-methyltransferase